MNIEEFFNTIASNIDSSGKLQNVYLTDGTHRYMVSYVTVRNGLFNEVGYRVGIDDDRCSISEALGKFSVGVLK